MPFQKRHISKILTIGFLLCQSLSQGWAATYGGSGATGGGQGLWEHDNLYVWDVVDSMKRGTEERARMLQSLGFRHYAYFAGSERLTPDHEHEFKDIHGDPDTQIEALQRHGIDVVAWYTWDGADAPQVKAAFESFKRHHIHPQIWIAQDYGWVAAAGFGTLHAPPKGTFPRTEDEWAHVSAAQWQQIGKDITKLDDEELPKTAQAQRQRVVQEASRIKALAELAAKYGCTVALYNHEGRWFGNEENELAIVTYLKRMGVANVGLAYNFSHAISGETGGKDYDDSKHFPELWEKIKPYVIAVNITAVGGDGIDLSQGKSELEMMRTIQESGWRGPVGVEVHHEGDAAVILRNDLIALDWLAAELRQPGVGGPRPQLSDPEVGQTH